MSLTTSSGMEVRFHDARPVVHFRKFFFRVGAGLGVAPGHQDGGPGVFATRGLSAGTLGCRRRLSRRVRIAWLVRRTRATTG